MLRRGSYSLRVFSRSKKRKAPETSLQATVVQLLRFTHAPHVSWVAVPNEGKRSVVEARRLKAMGMQPGAGDLHLCIQGRCHWLELKDRNRPQSDAQKDFQAMCERDGVPYAVARSFNDAKAILAEWGAIREENRRAA